MSKNTLKIVIISVISTLVVVGIIARIALPQIIDSAKTAAVTNFSDEVEELAFLLDESKEPVIQPNYIITGLIMSPDFQEYLDEGVQNGWWTEEFLEQFLIDEALPIFFTNYHGLFSLILGSEPVQNAGEQVTIIKAKVQQILYNVKGQIGKVSGILNSGKISDIKKLVASLNANKDELINALAVLQSLDLNQLSGAIADLQGVIDAISNIDKSSVESFVATVSTLVESLQNLDTDSIEQLVASLKDIKAQIEAIDKEQLADTIEQLKAIINGLQNLDKDKIAELLQTLSNLIELIENGDISGLLGDVLENILNSDVIQGILDDLSLTVDNLIKFINLYFTKFIDMDYDYNFYNPITIGDKTIDLSDYALLLNVLEVEIPSDGYVYDGQGTFGLSDDTITISTVYVGFEVDGEATTNILSEPIIIEGSQAIVIKNFIPSFNEMI